MSRRPVVTMTPRLAKLLESQGQSERVPFLAACQEASQKAERVKAGEERQFQRDAESYLGHNGVQWVFHERQSRGNQEGTPDLLFVYCGRPCAVELKTEAGRLSDAQEKTHERMQLDGWNVAVCRSILELKAFLATIREKGQVI